MHYGDFVNADGVLDVRGYQESQFFRMAEMRYPTLIELTPLTQPRVGEPLACKLTLFTSNGRPLRWEDIVMSHTERIHALVVDPSLGDHRHIHPQPAGPNGHYLLQLSPRTPGDHRVYLNFISMHNNRRILLETGFSVPDEPLTAAAAHRLQYAHADLEFAFEPQQANLVVGRKLRFRLRVAHQQGLPTTFATVMDAYARVVIFDVEGSGFAHLHPLNTFIRGQNPQDPDLEFAFQFDQAG